jgi:hypothetical protein
VKRVRGLKRKKRIDRRRLIVQRVTEAKKEARGPALDRDEVARKLAELAPAVVTFCQCGKPGGFRDSNLCRRCYWDDCRDEALTVVNGTMGLTSMDLLCFNQDEQEIKQDAANAKRKKARRSRRRASA